MLSDTRKAHPTTSSPSDPPSVLEGYQSAPAAVAPLSSYLRPQVVRERSPAESVEMVPRVCWALFFLHRTDSASAADDCNHSDSNHIRSVSNTLESHRYTTTDLPVGATGGGAFG